MWWFTRKRVLSTLKKLEDAKDSTVLKILRQAKEEKGLDKLKSNLEILNKENPSEDPFGQLIVYIKEYINHVDIEKKRNKSRAFYSRISTASISGLVTVLIGIPSSLLSAPIVDIVKLISLILSASITVIATIEAFYEPYKAFVDKSEISGNLHDLLVTLEIYQVRRKKEALDDAKQLIYFQERFQEIKNKDLSKWLSRRNKVPFSQAENSIAAHAGANNTTERPLE